MNNGDKTVYEANLFVREKVCQHESIIIRLCALIAAPPKYSCYYILIMYTYRDMVFG